MTFSVAKRQFGHRGKGAPPRLHTPAPSTHLSFRLRHDVSLSRELCDAAVCGNARLLPLATIEWETSFPLLPLHVAVMVWWHTPLRFPRSPHACWTGRATRMVVVMGGSRTRVVAFGSTSWTRFCSSPLSASRQRRPNRVPSLARMQAVWIGRQRYMQRKARLSEKRGCEGHTGEGNGRVRDEEPCSIGRWNECRGTWLPVVPLLYL